MKHRKTPRERRAPRASTERDAGRNRLDEDWYSEVDNGPSTVDVNGSRLCLYDADGRPLRRKVGF